MKNPIEIIKRDHKTVEELFKEYEGLAQDAYETKQQIVDKLSKEIRLHAFMEERIFYPKAKEVFTDEDDKMVEEAFTEHDVIKRLIEELSVTHPEDPQFDARVKVLNENITHHVMEEEQELLPKAETQMSEQLLNQLGEEMEAFKLEHADDTAQSDTL